MLHFHFQKNKPNKKLYNFSFFSFFKSQGKIFIGKIQIIKKESHY